MIPYLVVQPEVVGGAAPAAERERCYDFQCQEMAANVFRLAGGVVPLRVSEAPEPVIGDG